MKSNDDNAKSTQSKSTKKSTKSRSKSSKSETTQSNSKVAAAVVNSNTTPTVNNSNVNSSYSIQLTTPTTPTSSISNPAFDANVTPSGSSGAMLDLNSSGSSSGGSRHHKSYAGFEPRSIKIIWEQHDQSDLELSQEVCMRLAEDASYKLWELINNLKTHARHSGGVITYDLVNEVLRDADVPPALGAMDSAWDRVDYDGSFFFYSDKILELRDEYQKEISIEIPNGADFVRSFVVDDKHVESLKKYIPSLVYVMLHGDSSAFETVLQEVAFSPLIGSCYRVLLVKIIQILAYKQSDRVSERCWRLIKACTVNPTVHAIDCREEYFHLAEILICQLIGPFESIKIHNDEINTKSNNNIKTETKFDIKLENDDLKISESENAVKTELLFTDQQQTQPQQQNEQQQSQIENENIYRLQAEEDGTNDADLDLSTSTTASINVPKASQEFSPYFASPVDIKYIDDLCTTLGHLAAISGYFENECLFLILRRLERFFNGREVSTEREYNYIGRTLRGLISLGEFAFREFIPFIYKFKADDIPEKIWNDIALSAVYLQGPDDIFLYEWLEYVCGSDKLQPFLVYYAEYHEKLLTTRFLQRKQPTFKINPKLGVRRLEWSTLAAAMCHGDDPNALKPKPTLSEIFPDLTTPNLKLNRAGIIRFKFAGCRPVKTLTNIEEQTNIGGRAGNSGQNDILIAKRKLYKPLTNEKRTVALSSYYYLRV